MEFIGTPGIPTHARGHVIDLTFSNIPFAYTEVLEELHCGSDHATQVTTLTNRGTTEWDQYRYRIKEVDLPRLDGLMANQLAHLNDVDIQTTTEIETHVSELANALEKAIRAIGKIDRKVGKASPWWTDECREAHRAHIEARRGSDPERKTNATHLLQKVVRQAKRSYWAMRLDGVKDDKELYRVMGWHKLTPEMITCVLPVALFGTEVWYAGKLKPSLGQSEASTGTGIKGHLRYINKVINTAARGAIPVYKTTPTAALIKEAGLPSGIVALEHAKLR
ncbi:hypothetical protein BPOR_1788g00010 [Botrytis porri]|uniref:Endonuclease/exonuclease/phosphatase domain-containing protein n=1 Tax=Botrytis porri TaxID=87229 RepID=A0A4Z1K2E7_9HELO|nr:hypothetical protein BPOR_1788g00010 [Botrytis porri]